MTAQFKYFIFILTNYLTSTACDSYLMSSLHHRLKVGGTNFFVVFCGDVRVLSTAKTETLVRSPNVTKMVAVA
jgi:hypothetical protein